MHVFMLTDKNVATDPDAPEIGGASRQCLKLSKALNTRHVQITIVSRKFSRHAPTRTIIDGIQVFQLNTLHQLFNRRGLRRLEVYCFLLQVLLFLISKRMVFDIIHCHSAYFPAFAAVLAGRLLQKPTIIKVMNSGFRNDIFRLRNEKTIWGSGFMAGFLKHADRAVVLNDLAFRQLLEYGFKPQQLAKIRNGVETQSVPFKTNYRIGRRARVIFVGRLDIAKGLDTLLEAFNLLVKSDRNGGFHLTLLGKGPLREKLQQYAVSHELSDIVTFEGERSNVNDYLTQSDIFVLPSEAEGISNSLLEAMAIGLPCIVSDIDGNNDLIKNGQNGLTVKPGDKYAMTHALERLRQDHGLRSQLGTDARRTVTQKFDIQATAGHYVRLYRSLLKSGGEQM